MLKLIVFSQMAILLFTLCFTMINGSSMESDNQFTDSPGNQNQATGGLTMHKRPSFYVGSRYGRSGVSSQLLSSLKTRRFSVVPRNDRFFLSSRYGKRAEAPLDATTRNDFMTPFTAYERALLSEVPTGVRLNDKFKMNDNNSLPSAASAASLLSTPSSSSSATVMSCIYTGLENYYRCNSINEELVATDKLAGAFYGNDVKAEKKK
uniref:Uncharacterized protein n=1 Tax=Glossina austeni TaxID=7395 RepID=A0A1A9V246_GLOAU